MALTPSPAKLDDGAVAHPAWVAVPAGHRGIDPGRAGVDPLVYPSLGGSLPDYVFTKILGVLAFVTAYANADKANHAPNENLAIARFVDGVRTGAALLARLDAMRL